MAEKLFKSLRVVFGSPHSAHEREELKRWAQNEYSKDWQFAYSQLLKGKQPIRGVDY